MGNGLSPSLKKLIEERKITKIRIGSALVAKEIVAAEEDLKDAKWTTPWHGKS